MNEAIQYFIGTCFILFVANCSIRMIERRIAVEKELLSLVLSIVKSREILDSLGDKELSDLIIDTSNQMEVSDRTIAIDPLLTQSLYYGGYLKKFRNLLENKL